MDWIKDNVGLFILILSVLALVILIVIVFVLRKLHVLVKNTIDSSLKMQSGVFYDSVEMKEELTITVFNTNFRDIIIHSFGFIYKNQQVDFVREYMDSKDLKDFPVVPARSSISFSIEPVRMEKFILDNNFDKKNISSLYNIVTDSVGFTCKLNNRGLRKAFQKRNKARIRKAKVIIHNEVVKAYMDSHDGKAPFSHSIWKMFHKSDVKIPTLVEVSQKIRHDEQIKVTDQKVSVLDNAATEDKTTPAYKNISAAKKDLKSKEDNKSKQ